MNKLNCLIIINILKIFSQEDIMKHLLFFGSFLQFFGKTILLEMGSDQKKYFQFRLNAEIHK